MATNEAFGAAAVDRNKQRFHSSLLLKPTTRPATTGAFAFALVLAITLVFIIVLSVGLGPAAQIPMDRTQRVVNAQGISQAQTSAPASTQRPQPPFLQVLLDRQKVPLDVPPHIVDGRTLVPVRALAEALGFQVHWDPEAGVELSKGTTTIHLQPGARELSVDGRYVTVDVAPQIIGGRTMVPLRFVSEHIGLQVEWHAATGSILLWSSPTGNRPGASGPLAQDGPPAPGKPDLSLLETAPVGLTAGEVQERWGAPLRTAPGPYGYTWWVYEPAPDAFVRVALRHGRAQAIEVFSRRWGFGGVKGADRVGQVRRALTLADVLAVERDKGREAVVCQGAHQDSWTGSKRLSSKVILVLRHDQTDGDVPMASLVTTDYVFDTLPSWLVNCQGRLKSWQPDAAMLAAGSSALHRERERQFAQLVNVERVGRGLQPLSWRDDLARIARAHSLDMLENNFFDHQSPRTGGVDARFAAAGLPCRCGENLAYGYGFVFDAHLLLMDSPGHRNNVLLPQYTHLGIGIAGDYYTQNFFIAP